MPILTRQRAIVTLLLLATFFKGLIWAIAIPIWHGPDEAAHFAKVQLYGEDIKPIQGYDHSQELLLSERLLGTERNEKGNNKFTYNPQYRIEYSDNNIGIYESEIKNFPKSYRTDLVKKESASYPFMYYKISGFFYKLFYSSDIFVRTFSVRFFSILCLILTVYLAYKIGLLVFKNNFLFSVSLASLVSFQPMMSFTSSVVNSDNLGNLFSTAIIYIMLKIINTKIDLKKTILLSILIGFGLLTKPQTLVFLFSLIFLPLFLGKKQFIKSSLLIILGILIALVISRSELLRRAINNWNAYKIPLPYLEMPKNPESEVSFLAHFKNTINHTIREVLPWYWGVFNWLGVVLPRTVNRIIMRILAISLIGIIIYFIKIIRTKNSDQTAKSLFFLSLLALNYFLAVTVWDYSHLKNIGFNMGIQGRYFLPVVVSHMSLILIGLQNFFFFLKSTLVAKVAVLAMIILNFIALNTLLNAYYNTSVLNIFINQISQYKPEIFKGNFIIFIFAIFILTIIIFLSKLYRFKQDENQ